jgi:hypothetical protein
VLSYVYFYLSADIKIIQVDNNLPRLGHFGKVVRKSK